MQDRGDAGPFALQDAVQAVARETAADPGCRGGQQLHANQPQLFVDVDRTKAKNNGVELPRLTRRCRRISARRMSTTSRDSAGTGR